MFIICYLYSVRGENQMPVVSNPINTRLQLVFNIGTDEEGKPINKTKTLSNVKPDATDQDLLEVAQAISGLQKYALSSVIRINQGELVNE